MSDTDSDYPYPLLLKPSNLSGGKGIKIISNSKDFNSIRERMVGKKRFDLQIVQEFIDGSNHGFFSLIKNGKIKFFRLTLNIIIQVKNISLEVVLLPPRLTSN